MTYERLAQFTIYTIRTLSIEALKSLQNKFGFTVEHVVQAARVQLQRTAN